MQAAGLAIKDEPYTLRVPRSQRGGEIIEPMVRDQWFIKMEPLAVPALAAVANGDIKIVPERFEKTYNHWLENIRVRDSNEDQGAKLEQPSQDGTLAKIDQEVDLN